MTYRLLGWFLANEDTNIVTIVAWAGVGKSTLVNHWLRAMAAQHYRSAELVFGWSFYRQGTSGGTSSADEFLDAALGWFGDPDPRIGTAWEKGERLAKLISHRRTLLILDGLEPLQKSAWSARRTASRSFTPGAFARARCIQYGALCNYHAVPDCGHCRSRAHLGPAPRPGATLQRCRSEGAPRAGR